MNLLEGDDVPLTVHEDIINYLKEQCLLGDEDEGFIQNITNFSENNIRDILERLLQKIEVSEKLKEDYAERCNAHNQHPLFDLKNILPDYEVDEEIYNKLTFRETLIIQHLTDDVDVVDSVGGLCLDIQQAPGEQPEERKCHNIDSQLARIMKTKNSDVVRGHEIDLTNEPVKDPDDVDLEDSLETQNARNRGKFLLHLSSQFDMDGYNAGSSITTWIDRNMHTLEEMRKEFYTAKSTEDVEDDVKDATDQTLRAERLSQTGSEKNIIDDKPLQNSKGGLGTISEIHALKAMSKTRGSLMDKDACGQIPSIVNAKRQSKTSGELNKIPKMLLGLELIETDKENKERSAKLARAVSQRISKGVGQLTKEKHALRTGEKLQLIEKTLYVGLLKKYYYVKHFSNANNLDDRKFVSTRKARDYISEGANFLLMRYLAITIYIGTFELSTMYINGDLCRNIYNCTGPESRVVNDKKIDVCRIQRTIIEECGLEHNCLTILTLQGQIVYQEWEGISYILKINPLLDVTNYNPVGNEKLLLKNAWESDMQLMSKYLDEKVANEMKIKSYMIDHPEFRNMIADYIHTILLLKPEDIIEFTITHFLSFAPQFLPQNDYY